MSRIIRGKASSGRIEGPGRDLQPLPKALVHENLDIYATVEHAAVRVNVLGDRMGCATSINIMRVEYLRICCKTNLLLSEQSRGKP